MVSGECLFGFMHKPMGRRINSGLLSSLLLQGGEALSDGAKVQLSLLQTKQSMDTQRMFLARGKYKVRDLLEGGELLLQLSDEAEQPASLRRLRLRRHRLRLGLRCDRPRLVFVALEQSTP